jgi:hypothetical protein
MSKLWLGTLLVLGLISSSLQLNAPYVSALSGWKAGRIIDDGVFTASSSMSAAQIQSFLNGKVTSCDTNGAEISELGGPDLNGDGKVQRWEWGKSKYNQTKFICLKDYVKDGKTASQIIYEKAQKYRISPKVLIVLLQKEQSLVTDTWPLSQQYRTATGYGCPDTAPCDSQYYGLANQIDWAAKMFRAIMDNSPDWYTPYELGNNYIQYSPDASCGGSTVNIENRATQGLYNYTPYQPNKAARDAGWGSASCGAYGNRNFYLYFTGWFGSTRDNNVISLDSCSTNYYISESKTLKKYQITAEAMTAWGLSTDDAAPDTARCDYATSGTTISSNKIQSTTTNKIYLVDMGNAYYLSSQAMATSWGLGDLAATAHPRVSGDILNAMLTIRAEGMPRLAESANPDRSDVYLVDNAQRFNVAGSSVGDTASTRLVSGYGSIPVRIVSVALLQTLTLAGDLDYMFTVGTNLYILNHYNLLKVTAADKPLWTAHHTSNIPSLSTYTLSAFGTETPIEDNFIRTGKYHKLDAASVMRVATSKSVADNWGGPHPGVTQLLTNKITAGSALSNDIELVNNTRLIECGGEEYLVERNIRRKRVLTERALIEWGFNNYYFFVNDRGCAYPTYTEALGDAVRSRNTGKVYFVEANKAYLANDDESSQAYGIGPASTTVYPQFDPDSILDNLTIVR